MRKTYQNAKYVLILDSDLQFYASGNIIIFEALFRFFLSRWMSRFWTLQEVSLTRTIWIEFEDQSVELNVLMAHMTQLKYADLTFLSFSVDINRQFYNLRLNSFDNTFNEKSSSNSIAMSLFMLDMALQHRATNVAADESLCIENLLDLSAEEILKVPATSTTTMERV